MLQLNHQWYISNTETFPQQWWRAGRTWTFKYVPLISNDNEWRKTSWTWTPWLSITGLFYEHHLWVSQLLGSECKCRHWSFRPGHRDKCQLEWMKNRDVGLFLLQIKPTLRHQHLRHDSVKQTRVRLQRSIFRVKFPNKRLKPRLSWADRQMCFGGVLA